MKSNFTRCSNVSKKASSVLGVYNTQINTDATQIPHSNVPFPSEWCWFQNEQDAELD